MSTSASPSWKEVTVEEIAAHDPHALATGPFGSAISAKHFRGNGVPVIRGSNLSTDVGRRLVLDGLAFLTLEKAREFHRSAAHHGDLVFTCWGTVGQVGFIDERCPYREFIVSNKQMKLTPDPSKADGLFLYYVFSGPALSGRVRDEAIGSSVPGFNLGQLRALSLLLPPLAEQHRIASVLGALDDKIELNRRMNETLEALASGVMLSESSIVSTFGDIAENIRDVVHPGVIDSETPYIALDHMPRQSIALTEWGRADSASSAKARFRVDDVLFGKLRPYFHKVGVAPCDGVSSTDILVIRPKAPEFHALAVAVASSRPFVAYATATSTGTKMPRASWRDLADYEFEAPEPERLTELNRVVDPLLARIRANVRESRTLATLRDALLPKLISGELRIRDVLS